MTKEEIHEFELALLGFVKEASSQNAPLEELEALPKVASVLVELLSLTH